MARFKPEYLDNKTRIVIADDSQYMRTMLRKILAQLGMNETTEVSDPEAVIGVVETVEPQIILLDIDMGGSLLGLKLLHEIKMHHPNTSVIIISALSQKVIQDQARLEQADAFLLKPIRKEQVATAISMAIGYR